MTELEKIIHAKNYIDKLAEGINPLDNSRIPDGDTINNVRLSRCLFYVSDILRQVIDNGGEVVRAKPVRKGKKVPFSLSDEAKLKLIPAEKGIAVRDITEKINSFVDENLMSKLKQATINSFLVEIEMLEILLDDKGRNIKRPTEQGRAMGIYTEERMGQYGPYTIVCYNKDAQQFIYDNIDAIIEFNNRPKEKREKAENEGKGWDSIQDEILKDLFKSGATVEDIAYSMQRSAGGIRKRLKRLGLIED